MVKSMTGFGRAEISNEKQKMLVEMKAVNHRYLDINIKLPKKLNLFESRIRTMVKQFAERGKVDLFIICEDYTDEQFCLRYNQHLAGEYMEYFQQMSQEFGIENNIKVSDLARFPEVFSMERAQEDEESLWYLLEEAVKTSGVGFVEQRRAEGAQLKKDLLQKLTGMEEGVSYIEEHSPEVIQQYCDKLEAKVRELMESNTLDEARIMTEVTIFADKTCVDEETVRLRSHIRGMRDALQQENGESVGRKLDFIAQEMNREANTILSKCSNMDVSSVAIQLKTEIEKIREQVQNIE